MKKIVRTVSAKMAVLVKSVGVRILYESLVGQCRFRLK